MGQVSTVGGSADPEGGSSRRVVPVLLGKTHMVVAANPLASKAGRQILERGGSAIDAAIAIQAVLNVVEPQSSGVAGGAFLLHFDRTTGDITVFDGREEAPFAADPGLFMQGGSPLYFWDAVVGGRAVGVPGVLRALELAHQESGNLAWSVLFDDAIHLATNGFEVSNRLHSLLAQDPFLRYTFKAGSIFYDDDNSPLPSGQILQLPELAQTLTALAERGPSALYEGPIADDIIQAVHRAHSPSQIIQLTPFNLGFTAIMAPKGIFGLRPAPGLLTHSDLKDYQAKKRAPICLPYRSFNICGAPPPTSGGVSTLQIMGILSQFDFEGLSIDSPEVYHLFAEAQRLAFADRALYLGDPNYMTVTPEALLDPNYLRNRAQLIHWDATADGLEAGLPTGALQGQLSQDESPELPCTTHFVVVDQWGNVASMTSSIENVFGSRIMAAGMLLNNQLTDFSFVPTRNGKTIVNAVAPKKRPRSSMAPIIVTDRNTGDVVLTLGSPGGSQIIGYVAQSLLAVLEFGLSPQDAINLPHIINRGGKTELERTGWRSDDLMKMKSSLEKKGHTVVVKDLTSGLHAIGLSGGTLTSGADPRREGAAAGR